MSYLTIVGTGIGGSGQMTYQARASIQEADVVFYAVADHLMVSLIKGLNKNNITLSDLYDVSKDRVETYHAMTDRIITALETHEHVCGVFYGHPGVFTFPSHEAVIRARRLGHHAIMQPGVSAEDCLFADLGIDPSRAGCQSYEVTDFLVRQKIFDTSASLILWQIGALGEMSVGQKVEAFRLSILVDYLQKFYSPKHSVYLYEASQNAFSKPTIYRIELRELPVSPVSPISTLYVPPLQPPAVDKSMYDKLMIPSDYISITERLPSYYTAQSPQAAPGIIRYSID